MSAPEDQRNVLFSDTIWREIRPYIAGMLAGVVGGFASGGLHANHEPPSRPESPSVIVFETGQPSHIRVLPETERTKQLKEKVHLAAEQMSEEFAERFLEFLREEQRPSQNAESGQLASPRPSATPFLLPNKSP
jgi:hypothetical protein